MKIVHIIDTFKGGGIANFLLSLLPAQGRLGHNITCIIVEKFDNEYCYNLSQKLKKNNVEIICLNKLQANKISLIRSLLKCRRLLKHLHPDIVNTHGPMSHFIGGFSTMFTNLSQCCTIHSAPEKWGKDIRWICSNKPLIFCSKAAYENRAQQSNCMISIDNGVAPELIQTSSITNLRSELNLQTDDKIVVLAGSLRPVKNYEFLKDIVDELNNTSIHFCICGGNYGTGYIDADTFNGYPTIHCIGLRSDMSAIENGSDLFLSCSLREGLPISVLEAYFNGIPCVLSPIPQHKAIAQDITACIIPEDFTPKAFATAILKSLKNHETHNEIYLKRKANINKFTITNTAKLYINFYEQIKK
ncbi:glycosyltransferase [uncultured Mediterranea sp.]|uniref:glycosyltransferase family 4 protein n=1 Tax=uncultured Mediterranea sp. TaxID=1926662 RepID=UPI0027D9C4A3|nr:glycosyltransferase [uncultured Mediterranea sp.]